MILEKRCGNKKYIDGLTILMLHSSLLNYRHQCGQCMVNGQHRQRGKIYEKDRSLKKTSIFSK